MKNQREDRLLSVEEIAAYLGLNPGTVYKWIKRKAMPARKLGSLWKFRKEEVDQWVDSGGAALPDSDDDTTEQSQ